MFSLFPFYSAMAANALYEAFHHTCFAARRDTGDTNNQRWVLLLSCGIKALDTLEALSAVQSAVADVEIGTGLVGQRPRPSPGLRLQTEKNISTNCSYGIRRPRTTEASETCNSSSCPDSSPCISA